MRHNKSVSYRAIGSDNTTFDTPVFLLKLFSGIFMIGFISCVVFIVSDKLVIDKRLSVEFKNESFVSASIENTTQNFKPEVNHQTSKLPNDAYNNLQWNYAAINLPEAWVTTTGNSSVIVAVIDTGVFMEHEDLADNLLSTGYDFISSTAMSNDGDGIDNNPDDPGNNADLKLSTWHGTHVAGIIAASSNNIIGVTGAAHNVRIMPIRAIGINGGKNYDIAQGIRYAAGLSNDSGSVPEKPADIICLSLGGSVFSRSLDNAIQAAQNAGVIIIASAGNVDMSGLNNANYPSEYFGVISVGAVSSENEIAAYSNYGSKIDLVAPGGQVFRSDDTNQFDDAIYSTYVDTSSGVRKSGYAKYRGTSMAAAHVAGVVALMKSVNADLTPRELNRMIANGLITTNLVSATSDDEHLFGYGLIDARKAVKQASELATMKNTPL